MTTNSGTDVIITSSGDDVITVDGAGDKTIDGGAGADTLNVTHYSSLSDLVSISYTPSTLEFNLTDSNSDTVKFTAVEKVTVGGSEYDFIADSGSTSASLREVQYGNYSYGLNGVVFNDDNNSIQLFDPTSENSNNYVNVNLSFLSYRNNSNLGFGLQSSDTVS